MKLLLARCLDQRTFHGLPANLPGPPGIRARPLLKNKKSILPIEPKMPSAIIPSPFILQQRFCRQGLGFLWNKRSEIDPGQLAIINALYNNRKKSSIECSQSITYSLSKSKAGAMGYGRFYGSKGSLETLEKECRGTICKKYYHDIDIVNCHPVLMEQFAARLGKDLPEVDRLCRDRDAFLRSVGGTRDEAKDEVLRIIYGSKNTNEALCVLAIEVRNFVKFLSTRDEYLDLWKYSKTQDNIYGCFLSYILQTEERKCMVAMKTSFETQGWSVDVLCYDGVMIGKRDGLDLTEAMRSTERDILQDTGYHLSLVNKEFSSFDIPTVTDEVALGVSRAAYEEMKASFEEKNFYYAPTNEYFQVKGSIISMRMSLEHAREYYSIDWRFSHSEKFGDFTAFFDIWRKDGKRRCIDRIDMKPSDDPKVFVMAPEFAWRGAEGAHGVDMFLTLIGLVGNAAQQEYILNWLAHLIQKPFDLPGVALIITGTKGCGKDTLFDFLMKFVIGPDYSHNYTSNEQFFDRHDANRMSKFLVKLEEANRFICLRNADTLKALITSDSLSINPKCQKAISAPNYNRFIFTTNGGCPVEMTDGERRFVLAPCKPHNVGNVSFWNQVHERLFTAPAGAAVGEFLAHRNISTFNPRVLPVSEFQTAMVDAEISSEQIFIEQWNGEKLEGSEFFVAYRDYCISNSLPYAQNAKSLGMRLGIALRDGLLVKKRFTSGICYLKE